MIKFKSKRRHHFQDLQLGGFKMCCTLDSQRRRTQRRLHLHNDSQEVGGCFVFVFLSRLHSSFCHWKRALASPLSQVYFIFIMKCFLVHLLNLQIFLIKVFLFINCYMETGKILLDVFISENVINEHKCFFRDHRLRHSHGSARGDLLPERRQRKPSEKTEDLLTGGARP